MLAIVAPSQLVHGRPFHTYNFTLITNQQDRLVWTERAPSLILMDIKQAAQRTLEKLVAHKTGDPQLSGRRAYVDPVSKVLRADNDVLDPLGKGVLKSVHCRAVWAQTRLYDAGYDVDRLCPLCKEAEDTVHHRVWCCKESAGARNMHASQTIIREALRAGDDSALFCRAIGAHPADERPLPREDGGVVLEREGVAVPELHISGDIYLDGSCTRHMVPELQRAGWAVVQLNEHGEVAARASVNKDSKGGGC